MNGAKITHDRWRYLAQYKLAGIKNSVWMAVCNG